jgi:hypothetical protein
MKPPRIVILCHKSEYRSATVSRHVDVLREVLPHANGELWDKEVPDMRDAIVIKVGNSVFLGKDLFGKLQDGLRSCRYAYFVSEDYKWPPATQVRHAVAGKPNVVLTNCPGLLVDTIGRATWDFAKREIYINWNETGLGMHPLPKVKRMGLFYFGQFRPDRAKSFKKWFHQDLYDVFLSATSPKQQKHYSALLEGAPRIKSFECLKFEEFGQHAATIYLEDDKTHQQFHSMANRFYECISLGIAQFFDVACVDNLKKAGIYEGAKEFVVSSPEELAKALPRYDAVRRRQRTLWGAIDYRARLVNNVRQMAIKEGLLC